MFWSVKRKQDSNIIINNSSSITFGGIWLLESRTTPLYRSEVDGSLEHWQIPNVSEQYKEPNRTQDKINNTIISRESLLLLVENLLPI
jgi:uncharacterized protein (UPF0254 family)